jgi:D-tyrosyl-tRNA(Tyr) deacylase
VTGEIGAGLAVFVGIERTDEPRDAKELARKVAQLRIFEDDRAKFAHSLLDTSGSALVVSQFTLVANTEKGNRPSFTNAAPPEQAEPLYEEFCAALAAEGIQVETGVFGVRMAVELVNDGPVTIVLG